MKMHFKVLETWSPEEWLHQQLCLRMGTIKATLKQMKPISPANLKDMANNLFIKCQPRFSLPCKQLLIPSLTIYLSF